MTGQQAAVEAYRMRRGELRLTQAEVADKAGISARALVNFETGSTWPQPQTRARLEAAVGWPVGALGRIAAGLDPMQPDPAVPTDANPVITLTELATQLRKVEGEPVYDAWGLAQLLVRGAQYDRLKRTDKNGEPR